MAPALEESVHSPGRRGIRRTESRGGCLPRGIFEARCQVSDVVLECQDYLMRNNSRPRVGE